MAYRAEIEIIAKGVTKVTQLQKGLNQLAVQIDHLNGPGSLGDFNKQLAQAANLMSRAQQGTVEEKRAVEQYVTALKNANEAQERTNTLVAEEIRQRDRATASLERYNAAAAAATQRGAQTTMAGSYLRGQPKFGPEPAPGFNPIAGAARTRAALLASEAIAEGREAQRLAQQKIELTNKVNQADRRAFIELNNDKIRGIQKRLDAEIDAIGTKLSAAIKADNAEGAKFDQELARRTRLTADAEALYLKIREDSEKRIEARRKAGLTAAKKLEQDIAKQRADKKTRRNNAISSGLIGGAFPLLFGQGGGAAIGGGIGGFAGGLAGGQMGFALSLVGTQFGAFVDQIVSGGATLGQALNPLTADLDALAEAAGFAGTETGKALNTIQQLGSEQQALEAATALLAATVGNEGVEALRQFGSDTQELSNAFSRAMALMQTAAAQLFGGITKLAAAAVSDAVDLQAGLTNINDPRLKKLRAERADLQTNDGEGAVVGENTEANLRRIAEINQEIIDIVAANRIEVEKTIKAEARRLQNAELLGQFGEKDAKLQKIKNSLAGVEKDLTDENFVSLQRQLIQRNKELNLDKARALVGKDENGQIRDNGLLAEANARINQIALNEEKELNRDIEKAIEAKNKKLASGVKNTSRQNKQLLQQKEQASALTAALERQLAQSKVAGTLQAQKLAIEGRYEQTLERIAKLKDQSEASEQRQLAAQIRTTALAKFAFDQEQKRAKALRDAVAPLKQIRDNQEANLAASREYNRLVMEGMLPAEAKRISEFNKQVSLLLQQKDIAIDLLQIEIDRAKLANQPTEDMQKKLDDLRKGRVAIESEAAKGPGKGKSNKERIEDAIGDAQGELNKLIDPVNQVVAAAGAIGDAFSESFKGVISGSMSAQQALANLFQKTADHFLDMTAQIIAAAIKAQAIQFIGSIIGSTASAGASASAGPSPLNLDGVQQYVDTSPVLTKSLFAEGGYVSSPTNALIGEGGEPEYVIPESKMRTAMSRYSRGSRGDSVISGSGATESTGEGGGGGTAIAAPIDVRYTVERINSVDYVTADQFQAGMQQAATQGAKQGEQQTLKRLQMSGSTRKRIGI